MADYERPAKIEPQPLKPEDFRDLFDYFVLTNFSHPNKTIDGKNQAIYTEGQFVAGGRPVVLSRQRS